MYFFTEIQIITGFDFIPIFELFLAEGGSNRGVFIYNLIKIIIEFYF